MDEQHTLVYDASDKILGRLASHVASPLIEPVAFITRPQVARLPK